MEAADGKWIVKLSSQTYSRLTQSICIIQFNLFRIIKLCSFVLPEPRIRSHAFHFTHFPSNSRERERRRKDTDSRENKSASHALFPPNPPSKKNPRKNSQPSITDARSSRGGCTKKFHVGSIRSVFWSTTLVECRATDFTEACFIEAFWDFFLDWEGVLNGMDTIYFLFFFFGVGDKVGVNPKGGGGLGGFQVSERGRGRDVSQGEGSFERVGCGRYDKNGEV